MLQRAITAIRAAPPTRRALSGAVKRALGVGLSVGLSLIILALSSPAAYPHTHGFRILRRLQQPAQAGSDSPQDHASARPLEAAKPIERELGGGEAHSYQLQLAAGQFVGVVVDQRRINV